MGSYKIGTDDPTIKTDAGSGSWGSKTPTSDLMGQLRRIHVALGASDKFIPKWLGLPSIRNIVLGHIGDDAVKHLEHYLQNTGKDYAIDLVGMVAEVPSAKVLYKKEISSAIEFVKSLQPGVHQITSGQASGSYNYKNVSKNWYFAVGGYSAWGKGKATVIDRGNGKREYILLFEYKFFDRYNWDKNKSVKIPTPLVNLTITDLEMGEFHRGGLAREFNMYGAFSSTITWSSDTPPQIIDPFFGTPIPTKL